MVYERRLRLLCHEYVLYSWCGPILFPFSLWFSSSSSLYNPIQTKQPHAFHSSQFIRMDESKSGIMSMTVCFLDRSSTVSSCILACSSDIARLLLLVLLVLWMRYLTLYLACLLIDHHPIWIIGFGGKRFTSRTMWSMSKSNESNKMFPNFVTIRHTNVTGLNLKPQYYHERRTHSALTNFKQSQLVKNRIHCPWERNHFSASVILHRKNVHILLTNESLRDEIGHANHHPKQLSVFFLSRKENNG